MPNQLAMKVLHGSDPFFSHFCFPGLASDPFMSARGFVVNHFRLPCQTIPKTYPFRKRLQIPLDFARCKSACARRRGTSRSSRAFRSISGFPLEMPPQIVVYASNSKSASFYGRKNMVPFSRTACLSIFRSLCNKPS